TYRQLKTRRVGLEILCHRVLGGESIPSSRKVHACQPVEACGGKEAQRIPAVAPGVADPLMRLEDDEVPSLLFQVVASRQTRLAGADDDGVELFCCWHCSVLLSAV